MFGLTNIVWLGLLGVAFASSEASTKLWYNSPAVDFQDGVPIGNGRLGAVIFGTISQEKVALNEDSLWSGGYQERVNPDALATFPSIVGNLTNGNTTTSNQLWVSSMVGTPQSERVYQPLGNIFVEFGHDPALVSFYNRTLDLKTGIAEVSYIFDGIKYTRQAIANYPLGVIGFRYMANDTNGISLNVSILRDEAQHSVESDLDSRSITLEGGASANNSLNFTANLRVVTSTGIITNNATALMITGAQEVLMYYNAESAFRYDSKQSWTAAMNTKLDSAVTLGWSSFLETAVNDYQSLSSRVSLDLGDSGAAGTLETGQRLSEWRLNGNVTYDPELLALAYNYGRYLLIGSSRPGSLPSNLQGVWNDNFNPPWGSKFTININTQMNYWPAETTNLGETHGPLFDHLNRMQIRGQYVAQTMYGANGWVCHHNTDLWGDCAPQDGQTYYAANTMGGAWLSSHLIEHYRFSKNATFASLVALPILSNALEFYYSFLITDPEGYYITSYGSSPENSYRIPAGRSTFNASVGIDQGTAHDRQVLYELFQGFIELSDAVGSTSGVQKAKDYLLKLRAPEIGSLGQILEFSGDYLEVEPGHRHLSHLVAVFPGSQISPLKNSTISDAALVSINRRMENGSGNMGWSRAWAAGIYARLFKGDQAIYHISHLISVYLADNLFDLNGSVFQIDGNLGLVGAFTEILLQSHNGLVHLAPALPGNAIGAGSVEGLAARGGFIVNMSWADHELTSATILSRHGGPLAVRIAGGIDFTVNGTSYTGPISTKAGELYSIALQ